MFGQMKNRYCHGHTRHVEMPAQESFELRRRIDNACATDERRCVTRPRIIWLRLVEESMWYLPKKLSIWNNCPFGMNDLGGKLGSIWTRATQASDCYTSRLSEYKGTLSSSKGLKYLCTNREWNEQHQVKPCMSSFGVAYINFPWSTHCIKIPVLKCQQFYPIMNTSFFHYCRTLVARFRTRMGFLFGLKTAEKLVSQIGK